MAQTYPYMLKRTSCETLPLNKDTLWTGPKGCLRPFGQSLMGIGDPFRNAKEDLVGNAFRIVEIF